MTQGVNRLTFGATSSRTAAEPTVPGVCLRPLLESLERLGEDTAPLRAALRIAPEQLDDPDAQVPCSTYMALLEGARNIRPRTNCALRLAEVTPIGAYPLVDYLVLSSPTVGEGLRRLARYYRLVGAPTPLDVRDDGDPVRVVLNCPVPFIAEYAMALPALHLRRENDAARPAFVSFIHEPEDRPDYERALGCAVHAGAAWNGLAFSRATWSLPMRRRDPVLLMLLERQADAMVSVLPSGAGLAARVRRALHDGLMAGDAGIDTIARALAIAPRTLQRRLAAEGTSFAKLLDSVRRDMAEQHLARQVLSIAEIAFLLGYSEPAAFHRAFRRWHRTTPRAFRAGSQLARGSGRPG